MMRAADAARGKLPDGTRGAGGATARNDLPIISGVQRQVGQLPEIADSVSKKVLGGERRVGAEVNIETRHAIVIEPHTNVVEMYIEVTLMVLFHEGDAHGLSAI